MKRKYHQRGEHETIFIQIVIGFSVLFILFILLSADGDQYNYKKNSISFATYNIWVRETSSLLFLSFSSQLSFLLYFLFFFFFLQNYMFHWPIRKLWIVETVEFFINHIFFAKKESLPLIYFSWLLQLKKLSPDVVALQEVRWKQGMKNQAEELASHLSQYPWLEFGFSSVMDDGSFEGIALLSKFPIVETKKLQMLARQGEPDTNNRTALLIVVDHPRFGSINVFNTHFSYSKPIQCRQMAEFSNFIAQNMNQRPTVLLGIKKTFNFFFCLSIIFLFVCFGELFKTNNRRLQHVFQL
jgi:hypothetical protein